GVASKANFIDAGMFSSSALSSPSRASNELIGFTAVNFQEPLHVPPPGRLRKYSERPPILKSWRVKVEGAKGGPQNRSRCRGSAKASQRRCCGTGKSPTTVRVSVAASLVTEVSGIVSILRFLSVEEHRRVAPGAGARWIQSNRGARQLAAAARGWWRPVAR